MSQEQKADRSLTIQLQEGSAIMHSLIPSFADQQTLCLMQAVAALTAAQAREAMGCGDSFTKRILAVKSYQDPNWFQNY